MAKRTTVFDLWSQKGKKKWPQTHIDTAKEAEAAYKAGIEIISCEPDHHFKDVRKVAPTAFLSVGLKHGLVSSPQEAIKKGFEIMEMGADAVLLNTAIAKSENPTQMALAMKLAVESGRLAHKSGRIPKSQPSPSSPEKGIIES